MLKPSDSLIEIFSDGGSRGNPGPAASAYVVYKNDVLIHNDSKYLGTTTNNIAEYNGVLLALEYVTENIEILNEEKEINFYMDSELVVKQLSGIYKIKNYELLQLSLKIKEIINNFQLKIDFIHVRREKNALADKLVNENLDEHSRR